MISPETKKKIEEAADRIATEYNDYGPLKECALDGATFGYNLCAEEKEAEIFQLIETMNEVQTSITWLVNGSGTVSETARKIWNLNARALGRPYTDQTKYLSLISTIQSQNAALTEKLNVAKEALLWMQSKKAITIFIEDESHVTHFFKLCDKALQKLNDDVGVNNE